MSWLRRWWTGHWALVRYGRGLPPVVLHRFKIRYFAVEAADQLNGDIATTGYAYRVEYFA